MYRGAPGCGHSSVGPFIHCSLLPASCRGYTWIPDSPPPPGPRVQALRAHSDVREGKCAASGPCLPSPPGWEQRESVRLQSFPGDPLFLPGITPMSFLERFYVLAYFNGQFHFMLRPFPQVRWTLRYFGINICSLPTIGPSPVPSAPVALQEPGCSEGLRPD